MPVIVMWPGSALSSYLRAVEALSMYETVGRSGSKRCSGRSGPRSRPRRGTQRTHTAAAVRRARLHRGQSRSGFMPIIYHRGGAVSKLSDSGHRQALGLDSRGIDPTRPRESGRGE